MTIIDRTSLVALGLALLLPGAASAASISVNFNPIVADSVSVDADESSVIGISGTETVSGTSWNNIVTRPSGSTGDATTFTAATQGGNHLDLIDSSGADSGINVTSAGTFFVNFGHVSNPNQSSTGDAGMMQSYMLSNSGETISLTGMSTWAPNGYKVYALFDIGPFNRTYGFTVTDGSTTQSFFTNDTAGDDADDNDDGIIEWLQTTATTSGSAVTDANYAVFGTFTGNVVTISGADSNRAPISGFQVVAIPEPSTGLLLGLATLLGLRRRR